CPLVGPYAGHPEGPFTHPVGEVPGVDRPPQERGRSPDRVAHPLHVRFRRSGHSAVPDHDQLPAARRCAGRARVARGRLGLAADASLDVIIPPTVLTVDWQTMTIDGTTITVTPTTNHGVSASLSWPSVTPTNMPIDDDPR